MFRKNYSISDLALIAGPIISLLFLLFMDLDPQQPLITRMAAVAILMAIWWITEAVPLAVTALLPVILFPTLGIMNGKAASSIYFNHIIFLFIGGFIVALAMQKWELHRRIALFILIKFGVKPGNMLAGFMVATAFLSMWISNTATTMMMLPIALAIVIRLEKLLGKEEVRRFSIGLFLALAYSASIGGIATLVGTPPNLSFVRIFSITFPDAPEISFAGWFIFALPISIIFLVVLWLLIKGLFVRNSNIRLDPELFRNQLKELGPMSFEEKIILADFILLIFLWLFRADISMGAFIIPGWSGIFGNPSFLNDGTVAITMALILFMVSSRSKKGEKIMDWGSTRELPWNIVLLFGGGFALASGFKESGLSIWMGEQLAWTSAMHPVVIVAIMCFAITFLTELTSNTATAEMLLPILAGLAIAIDINPLFLMIPATLSCSFAFMLPVATPPNAIVFGSQRLKISQMARAGIWMNLVGVVLITLAIYFLGQVVFDINLSEMPRWAQ